MISIIIPIFNAESSLRQMLDSVLAQTYKEYECILINDGSSDTSYNICKEYEKQDIRFRCFTQDNCGVSYARNRGLELAEGQYIAFLDADDFVPPNYLAELIKCCKNGDIAVCDTVIIENGKESFRFTLENTELTQIQAINELLSRKYINSGPAAKLYRKDIIDNIKYPPLRTYEDILFVLDAFSNAKKIVVTNQTQYFYIQNSDGAMSAMIKEPSLDIIFASEKLLQFIDQRHDLQSECCYATVSHLFQYAIQLLVSQNYINTDFIKGTRKLFNKYMRLILSCRSIPWKEKVTFFLFTYGVVLQSGKRLNRIREE